MELMQLMQLSKPKFGFKTRRTKEQVTELKQINHYRTKIITE